MLTISEIQKFIDQDRVSVKKNHALTGLRYYEADHDIKNYKVFYIDADGQIQEDKTKSNIKISHPFFTELVDQEVQYMLSNDEYLFRSDYPELQSELDAYFNTNENFRAELYELITGTVAKGFEYMYAYMGADGRTQFMTADSIGIVEVKAKEASDNDDHIIYWYVDKIGKDNKKITKIQVWDSKAVYFYVKEGEGKIKLDETEEINPKPHIIYKKSESGDVIFYEDYGTIPFFRLDNNRKQFSDLKPIKGIIDDYDLMACGLSNNIQDANEVLYVVKGFQGDNLDELMTNVRNKKHIGVDETGDIDIKTIDIPYEARKTKLDLDEANIYRFGMGFNASQVGDGNITNVVIKSRYGLLDLKCNKLQIKLTQFLRNIMKIVLKEINERLDSDFQQKDVYFDFKREIITNAQDNAQIELIDAQKQQVIINTLLALARVLDNETILQYICETLDVDYREVKERVEAQEKAEAKSIIDTAYGGNA